MRKRSSPCSVTDTTRRTMASVDATAPSDIENRDDRRRARIPTTPATMANRASAAPFVRTLRDLSTEGRDHGAVRIGGCDRHRRDQKRLACPNGYGRRLELPALECLLSRAARQEPRREEQRTENATQHAEAEAGRKRRVFDQRAPNEQGGC